MSHSAHGQLDPSVDLPGIAGSLSLVEVGGPGGIACRGEPEAPS